MSQKSPRSAPASAKSDSLKSTGQRPVKVRLNSSATAAVQKAATKTTQSAAAAAKTSAGPARKQAVEVILDTDDLVKEQVGGFVNFLREHAIVGLAVGFVVGQQAQGVVKQLITSFIDPAFQLFFGKKLSERSFTLHLGAHSADFGWGGMVYVLLNLLFVLAIIYILIKLLKLDKLDKPPT